MNYIYIQIFVVLAIVIVGNCYPAKNDNCDCVCGSRGDQRPNDDKYYPIANKHPWAVGVYAGDDNLCTGSLISNKHVLLSARCAKSLEFRRDRWSKQIEVRLGDNANNTVYRGIFAIYTHENYIDKYFLYDEVDFNIALLQLDQAVPFGAGIQPICLPESSSVDYSYKIATVTGWYDLDAGILRSDRAPKNLISQEIRVPIWTNEECAEIPHYTEKLTNNMICAGSYEDGIRWPCLINLGNDHIIFIEKQPDSMELVGMYTYGSKCGSVGIPTVYTRVANFLPWIRSKIKGCMCAPAKI